MFSSLLVGLDNFIRKWVKKLFKKEKLKKLDFHSLKKSLSRNAYVMRRKTKFPIKLLWISKISIPMVRIL